MKMALAAVLVAALGLGAFGCDDGGGTPPPPAECDGVCEATCDEDVTTCYDNCYDEEGCGFCTDVCIGCHARCNCARYQDDCY